MGLREERQDSGLSQADLARLAGIAQSNLSAYESGRRPASEAMLQRIRKAMVRPSRRLAEHRDQIADLIRQCGATHPRVFGSVARGQDTPASDLDILVTVDTNRAWEFVSLKRHLEQLLGCRVDVVSEGGLTERHGQIRDEAIPL